MSDPIRVEIFSGTVSPVMGCVTICGTSVLLYAPTEAIDYPVQHVATGRLYVHEDGSVHFRREGVQP